MITDHLILMNGLGMMEPDAFEGWLLKRVTDAMDPCAFHRWGLSGRPVTMAAGNKLEERDRIKFLVWDQYMLVSCVPRMTMKRKSIPDIDNIVMFMDGEGRGHLTWANYSEGMLYSYGRGHLTWANYSEGMLYSYGRGHLTWANYSEGMLYSYGLSDEHDNDGYDFDISGHDEVALTAQSMLM
ncbi:hypothetical protein L2E82_39841 [Cichorium intybus]|uniref:Uncharacterized protein n=1 Tax=Cichorium intybus TaxID=13427 RepID=A0ACB9AJP2_CICIN|nr:hypothetical protein L2E82_39841 [Cichorium intybus]